jgi:hypothetical protein
VARIVQAVREFEGGGPPSDDITLLVARRILTRAPGAGSARLIAANRIGYSVGPPR